MTDSELLLAMSNIVHKEVEPIKNEMKMIRIDLLENNVLPRLQNIEACYTSTTRRYIIGSDQIDSIQEDVNVMKKVISEHSVKLEKIS